MSTTSFALFSQLPAELRLEIWRLTCHQRVVELFYDAETDRCSSATALPSIFHTCQESRSEALRVYECLFGTKSHKAAIYFCPWLDTLYLPRPKAMGYDNHSRDFAQLVSDASQVLHLALDHIPPITRKPWETYNKYILMNSFPQVDEVSLVLGPETQDHHEGSRDLMLADPAEDPAVISKLLESVKESFSYEVGVEFDSCWTDDERTKAPPLVLKSMMNCPLQ